MKNHTQICFLIGLFLAFTGMAQESPMEEDYFRIKKVTPPEGTLLEVGGLTTLPNGNIALCTRRGEVYIVENPGSNRPYFRKFASGLHEPLGLRYHEGSLYLAQRGELTRLTDTDQDGKADRYETVYAWPLTGNYHEYSYGPTMDHEGNFYVSTNLGFFSEEWWRGESKVPFRGWMLKISPEGQMEPLAAGMRSPAGLGMIDGDLFYTENQGDYMASGGVWHVRKGDFVGNPAGLEWSSRPDSPIKLTRAEFDAVVDPRKEKNELGRFIKPENIQNEQYQTMFQVKEQFPELRLPAIWFPYGVHGISTSEPIKIPKGHFGPFEGQMLVGDQGQSKIMRVVLEEVKGELQGVAFDFRSNFNSGVLRMTWGTDGSLYVGETNRGWGSAGDADEGLERLVWNGQVPFDMRTVKAMPDGFEIEFTKPVDKASAEDIASYSVQNFTYKYHPVYGSPPVDMDMATVKGVKLSSDRMKVRIKVDGLKPYYLHHIRLEGVREEGSSYSLVHPSAYYTLNAIPDGPSLAEGEMSTYNSAMSKETPKNVTPKALAAASPKTDAGTVSITKEEVIDAELVKGLLTKHTCIACHQEDSKQVGPAYKDIAKRKYSPERIVELIYVPEPQNWPEYATPMPPMPHVPEEDALKIAKWINSLNE